MVDLARHWNAKELPGSPISANKKQCHFLGTMDEGRRYFLLELPVHPQILGVVQAHEVARHEAHHETHKGAHEELTETEASVMRFIENEPKLLLNGLGMATMKWTMHRGEVGQWSRVMNSMA